MLTQIYRLTSKLHKIELRQYFEGPMVGIGFLAKSEMECNKFTEENEKGETGEGKFEFLASFNPKMDQN